MNRAIKILKALLPRVLDVCVYKYVLSTRLPNIEPELQLDITVKKHLKGYDFYTTYNNIPVNENHIIFNNRLGRQLGYKNVPMLANSNTAEAYRGKSIQAYVLTEIAKYFAPMAEHDAVFVFTYTHNIAMQRALAKAQYIKLYKAKVYRIAGISLLVRRVHE